MKLVLGVLEVSYSDAGSSGATTTGEVATILEDRYHVMETFFELKKDQIAEILAEGMADSINSLINGRPPDASPTYDPEQQIELLFRTFLDANEMQTLAAKFGMNLTAAAARGDNARKKSGKSNARPTFIDTGTYRAAFRAWVEK